MKRLASLTLASIGLMALGNSGAATFSPNFSEFPFAGTQFTVNAAANAYYLTNYGITINNAYLYTDPRDTFDGIGIANGTVANISLPSQTGRINFIDLTNFVIVDFLDLQATQFNAYSSTGTLLSSFRGSGTLQTPQTGTFTLLGNSTAYISYLTFSTTGGYGGISGFSYNYDGTTGGGNTDLPPIPEPKAYAMFLLGLLALSYYLRNIGPRSARIDA